MTTDYHDFVTRDTPQHERRRLNIGDIWTNAATCNKCGDTVRSKNRHDFATCSCGATSVDGGSWYARRAGSDFTDASEPFADVQENAA